MGKVVRVVLILLASAAMPIHAASLFLIPSGDVTGSRGETVGWGFEIQNATDYLVVESSDFCSGPFATPCSDILGTYTDLVGPQFIIVGPAPESPVVSESFNLSKGLGLGSFSIDSPASLGIFGTSGNILVVYSLYRHSPNDPAFDPFIDLISTGNLLGASASIQVVVPEPCNVGLSGVGVAMLVLLSCVHWSRGKDR